MEAGSATRSIITLNLSANTLEHNFRLIIALHTTQNLNPPSSLTTPHKISASIASCQISMLISPALIRTNFLQSRALCVACYFFYQQRYLPCLSSPDTNTRRRYLSQCSHHTTYLR